MASNFEREPIFLLERKWDDTTKLPEKYKFQGRNAKAEVCIDSGTLGIEFFLEKTLAQFNQAGTRLNWSWEEAFSEFENVLGDSYRTTWNEVLNEHFAEPLEEVSTVSRAKKEDFDRAIDLFIKKTLDNRKPRDLQYIYMAPGGDYRLAKDLLTSPRVHSHRFKEMLRIAELLPAGDIQKPSEGLALQWYYMSYHKSDREKFVLSGKTLDDETIESVTTFFQALFEQRKLDGTIERQEAERLRKRLLREASEKLRGRLRDASDGRRSQRAMRELALRDDRRRYVDERGDRRRRRRILDDRDHDDRRPSYGASKRYRGDRPVRDGYRPRDNQPRERKSAAGRERDGKGSFTPCETHSSPGRPAKHSWAECSENPANQKKPAAKRPMAYYAHDERRPASDAASLSDHRTAPASDASSDEYGDSRSGYSDDEDNFAVAVTPVSRKRAKREVPPAKELTIAMSESDPGTDDDEASAKLGKLAAKLAAAPSVGKKRRRDKDRKGALRDPLDLSDSN
jgi:hypothetical protein